MRYWTKFLAISLVAAVACAQPEPESQVALVQVPSSQVDSIAPPDTVKYKAKVWLIDNDTWMFESYLMNMLPDTTSEFTHRGFYHCFFEWHTCDPETTVSVPFAWAYWSPLQNGSIRGRLTPATQVLQFKLMAGWQPPDSAGYRIVWKETGGRPWQTNQE